MAFTCYHAKAWEPQPTIQIRGQAEAVAPHRRPVYRRRLVAARRELSGIAAAYIDAILQRLDELDSLEVAR